MRLWIRVLVGVWLLLALARPALADTPAVVPADATTGTDAADDKKSDDDDDEEQKHKDLDIDDTKNDLGEIRGDKRRIKFAKLVDKPLWKLSLGAGLVLLAGNSNTTSVSGSGVGSWRQGNNRVSVDGNGAYARSQTLEATDSNGDGKYQANEIRHVTRETAMNWAARARYDRFFSADNMLYGAAQVGADPIAGKEHMANGQIGYARLLINDDTAELAVELGYDFGYEAYASPTDLPLLIHSIRAFVSYKLKMADEVNMLVSGEVLSNLNSEETPTGHAAPLSDTRVIGKAMLDAKLVKFVNLRFTLTARYDNVPAPRPGFAVDLPLDGFRLPADKMDTLTEVNLVIHLQ